MCSYPRPKAPNLLRSGANTASDTLSGVSRRVAVIVLVVLAPLASPAAAAARPCVAPGDRVVARGAEVLVTTSASRSFHACERRTHRRTRLDDRGAAADPDTYLQGIRIAGRYVAYVAGFRAACSTCPAGASVRLVNARSGRGRPLVSGCDGAQSIAGLVVDRRARLGWTCFSNGDVNAPGQAVLEVRKQDRDGPGLLDSSALGSRIVADSLSLRDGVLRWNASGQARSAPLR